MKSSPFYYISLEDSNSSTEFDFDFDPYAFAGPSSSFARILSSESEETGASSSTSPTGRGRSAAPPTDSLISRPTSPSSQGYRDLEDPVGPTEYPTGFIGSYEPSGDLFANYMYEAGELPREDKEDEIPQPPVASSSSEQLGPVKAKRRAQAPRKRKAKSTVATEGVSPITCAIIVGGRLCGAELQHNITTLNSHLGEHEKRSELPRNTSGCPFQRLPGKRACTSGEGKSKLSAFTRHVYHQHFMGVPRAECPHCGASYVRNDEMPRHKCKGPPPKRPSKRRRVT